MIVKGQALHRTPAIEYGFLWAGLPDTVITPSGSDEKTILSDGLTSTYVASGASIGYGLRAGFRFYDECPTDYMFLASKLYTFANNFRINAGTYNEDTEGYFLQFDGASSANKDQYFETASISEKYGYAIVTPVNSSNFKVYELYAKNQYIAIPSLTINPYRQGMRYFANVSAHLDNDEQFASYNAKLDVKVLSDSDFYSGDIDNAKAVFEDSISLSVNSTQDISCNPYKVLSADAGEGYHVCARISLTGVAGASYNSGWQTMSFATADVTKPQAPTIAFVDESQIYTKSVEVTYDGSITPSGLSVKGALLEVDRGDGSFEYVGETDFALSNIITDFDINPTIINKYRAQLKATDTNGDTVYGSYSNIIETVPYEGTFLASPNIELTDVFFIEYTSGKFENTNALNWVIGSTTPSISADVVKAQSGSMKLYLSNQAKIDQAKALIKENAPIKMIDPNGEYVRIMLLSPVTVDRMDVAEVKGTLSAEWQALDD